MALLRMHPLPFPASIGHHRPAAGTAEGRFRMGFRFRKSVRILPGVRLNLSKSGVSTSIGGKGATVNIGPRGTRTTVGLPGTGLSYSTMSSSGRQQQNLVAPTDGVRSGGSAPLNGCLALFGGAGFLALLVALAQHSPTSPTVDGNSSAVAQAMSTPAIVSARTLTCRKTPDRAAARIARYRKGARVTVVDKSGEWSEVDQEGVKCWLLSSYLTDDDDTAEAADNSTLSDAQSLSARADTSATRRSHRPLSHHSRRTRGSGYSGGACPCSGGNVCIGPRGGRYCITSGGNKRYGV